MEAFNIPIVLFFFKREDLILQVLERVAQVKPRKLYLFSDGGRSEEEWKIVKKCRESVEKKIDWECDVVRNYADVNRGVYESIGKGAMWVLSHEDMAIFLEDDNLPEITFFEYCKQMLQKYKNDNRILWVCGTNYLEEYYPVDNSSYMFTKHLLPCGWASWSEKFLSMYDGDLNGLEEEGILDNLKYSYENKALYRQQLYNFKGTYEKIRSAKMVSWDHQMCFSLRCNNVLGISPCRNQIKNIGVDSRSTHGGTSLNKVMTKRFCGMESKQLSLPLKHPKHVMVDSTYEKLICKIITQPLHRRIIYRIVRAIKPIFGFGKYDSVSLKKIKENIFNSKNRGK